MVGCAPLKNCFNKWGKKRASCEVKLNNCLWRPCRPCLACCCINSKYSLFEILVPIVIPFICLFGCLTCVFRVLHCPVCRDCFYSFLECFMEIDECIGLYNDVNYWREHERKEKKKDAGKDVASQTLQKEAETQKDSQNTQTKENVNEKKD